MTPCPCGRATLPGKPACPRCWRKYLATPGLARLERQHARDVATQRQSRVLPHSAWAPPEGANYVRRKGAG